MPLSSGTTLGRYKVLSLLGAGGMGEVYLAHDTRLNRKVALKVLPADLISNRQRLHRFEQEAQAASALNHPNIITIHEIGVEGKTHFIATEYIEGETLRQKIQTRLEIAGTLHIATQIAAALDAAHQSGIVHRDIKPENVMLRGDGLVKVLDFGLAKLAQRKEDAPFDSQTPTRAQVKTMPGAVMGTVAYMSPEQARGLEVDARTDIFSLGIVLYEMLTGRLPFEGATASDMIAAILKTEPTSLDENTPLELQRIVRKGLQKNADERYQTAKDLLIDLKALKHEQDFTAELKRSSIPTKSEQSALTQDRSIHTTFSAEYITSGIKQHKLSFAVALAVLLTALGLSYWYFNRISPTTTQIESIAVLPFKNESGNADTEYLSDGMTESLINSLSQLPNLLVKARSSVFRYKGKDVEPQTIASELSVQAILNGRVVQRGDSLTLYLSLVDARTGNQIWGEQYNRKLTDLVALQSEIARDVSQKLRARLSGADEQKVAKNYTANAEAYQLYLKGRFYWNKRTPQDMWKSIEYFRQAIALDPNYALAFTGLADAYALLSNYGDAQPRETKPTAREAALKALSLDDRLAEAHATLGAILNDYDYDFTGAEREYKRAIELNPNYASAHQWYGELLTHQGRHEEALAELRRALEIDPLSLIINSVYGESMVFARRYDEAITQLKKTVELDANFATAHINLSTVYQLKDNYAESIAELAKFQELIGEQRDSASTRESFAQGGWEGFLRAITGTRRPVNIPSYIVATFHAELGEKDKTFAELNKSYENREFFMVLLKVDPRFDDLRSDPRFQDLLRRVGFPQ
jgi:serine/threonine protein kinase/Flp pilus assembly protein TadD